MYIAPIPDSKTMQLSCRHSIFVTRMNEYKKGLKSSPRLASEQVCDPVPPWVCGWVYEGPLWGRMDGDDKMEMEFGAGHVAIMSCLGLEAERPLDKCAWAALASASSVREL